MSVVAVTLSLVDDCLSGMNVVTEQELLGCFAYTHKEVKMVNI